MARELGEETVWQSLASMGQSLQLCAGSLNPQTCTSPATATQIAQEPELRGEADDRGKEDHWGS